ncbi:MAG: hypothetical protein PHP54_04525 [Clostridia bacterium]|nr:hypothetical protein [Clostridia bacterium]
MGGLIFLILLFVFLLVYTMISTMIKISLYLTTKHHYSNIRLFLPTILTLIVFILLTVTAFATIKGIIGKTLFDILFDHFLRIQSVSSYLNVLLPVGFIYIALIVLLQALTYFCINVDLKTIFGKTRFAIKKSLHILPSENKQTDPSKSMESIELKLIENKELHTEVNNESQIALGDEKETLTFSTALIASLFTFCLIIFSSILFFVIGIILSDKLLA